MNFRIPLLRVFSMVAIALALVACPNPGGGGDGGGDGGGGSGSLQTVLDALTMDDFTFGGFGEAIDASTGTVRSSFTLPTGSGDTVFSWSTNRPDLVPRIIDGKVRIVVPEVETTVTFTVTASAAGRAVEAVSKNYSFLLTPDSDPAKALESASHTIAAEFLPLSGGDTLVEVTGDIALPVDAGQGCSVEWTVNETATGAVATDVTVSATGKLDVPKLAATAAPRDLTLVPKVKSRKTGSYAATNPDPIPIIVKPVEPLVAVQKDVLAVPESVVFTGADSLESVTAGFSLPIVGERDTVIAWDPPVSTAVSITTGPDVCTVSVSPPAADTEVTLTGTVTKTGTDPQPVSVKLKVKKAGTSKLSYLANYPAALSNSGAAAPTDNASYTSGALATVAAAPEWMTVTGRFFGSWNTKADGAGTGYAAGSTLVMGDASLTLYALWTSALSLSYDWNLPAGNTTSVLPPQTQSGIAPGGSATVRSTSFDEIITGYVQIGWNTRKDGSGTKYQGGDSVAFAKADITLYRLWFARGAQDKQLLYEANYPSDATGGSGNTIDSHRYYNGGSVSTLGSGFSLPFYDFKGWNTTTDGTGRSYAAYEDLVMGQASLTLYATWVKTAAALAADTVYQSLDVQPNHGDTSLDALTWNPKVYPAHHPNVKWKLEVGSSAPGSYQYLGDGNTLGYNSNWPVPVWADLSLGKTPLGDCAVTLTASIYLDYGQSLYKTKTWNLTIKGTTGTYGLSSLTASKDLSRLAVIGSNPAKNRSYVFTSTDSGATWSAADLPEPYAPAANWLAYAESPDGTKNVLVASSQSPGCYCGLFVSLDFGKNWVRLTGTDSMTGLISDPPDRSTSRIGGAPAYIAIGAALANDGTLSLGAAELPWTSDYAINRANAALMVITSIDTTSTVTLASPLSGAKVRFGDYSGGAISVSGAGGTTGASNVLYCACTGSIANSSGAQWTGAFVQTIDGGQNFTRISSSIGSAMYAVVATNAGTSTVPGGSLVVAGAHYWDPSNRGGAWRLSKDLATITNLNSTPLTGTSLLYGIFHGAAVSADATVQAFATNVDNGSGGGGITIIKGSSRAFKTLNRGVGLSITPSPTLPSQRLALNSDGTKLVLIDGTEIFWSSDQGDSWSRLPVPSPVSR